MKTVVECALADGPLTYNELCDWVSRRTPNFDAEFRSVICTGAVSYLYDRCQHPALDPYDSDVPHSHDPDSCLLAVTS